MTIDNVGVAEVSNNVPGTVGNLTVAPAPLGALKATVAFNAPTADAQGTALDAAVKINVYRDGTLVRTFAEAQPGEALSWLDEARARKRHPHLQSGGVERCRRSARRLRQRHLWESMCRERQAT